MTPLHSHIRIRIELLATTIAAIAVMLTSMLVPASATTRPTQPPSTVGVATDVTLTSAAASAAFVDASGKHHTLAELRGKTVFLVPMLTLCTDTCPFTTGNLLQLVAKLRAAHAASKVAVIAVDVDPYRDTTKRVAAYAKLIGATFPIWIPAGRASTPNVAHGTGDLTPSLSAIEQFFGWSAQVVAIDDPAPSDWMAPYRPLTYDINHSDGFWVIDANQHVRFESGNLPAYSGTLAKRLSAYMGQSSNIYKGINPGGWTPSQALGAISFVLGVALHA